MGRPTSHALALGVEESQAGGGRGGGGVPGRAGGGDPGRDPDSDTRAEFGWVCGAGGAASGIGSLGVPEPGSRRFIKLVKKPESRLAERP